MTSLIKIMNDEQAKAQKAHEKRQIGLYIVSTFRDGLDIFKHPNHP